MTPGNLDLTIYQGATFLRVVRLTGVDLTGCTARMQVRLKISSADPLLSLDEANEGALITDAAAGEITLRAEADDTALLDFTRGVYDLEVEYADGTVHRVLMGNVLLSKEVTREGVA